MNYIINEEKIKDTFFKYLSSLPELKCDHRGSSGDGSIEYYPIEHLEPNEFDEYDDPEKSFTYYPTVDSYEYPEESYESEEFPLIELDFYIYRDIINIFGEKIFNEFSKEWFNDNYNLNLNSVHPN